MDFSFGNVDGGQGALAGRSAQAKRRRRQKDSGAQGSKSSGVGAVGGVLCMHVKRWKVHQLLLVMRRRGRPFLTRPRGPGGKGTLFGRRSYHNGSSGPIGLEYRAVDEDVEECEERVGGGTIRDDSGAFAAALGKWGLR